MFPFEYFSTKNFNVVLFIKRLCFMDGGDRL